MEIFIFQFIGCFNTKFHVLSLDIVFQFLAFESCTKCDEEFEASLWCVEFFNKHNASFLEFDPASFIGVDRFGDTVEAAGNEQNRDSLYHKICDFSCSQWWEVSST